MTPAPTPVTHLEHLERLVARVAAGDHGAMASLYDLTSRFVYRTALRILRNAEDAEEVTFDVFTQAWRQAGRFDARRGSVEAWLTTMTRCRAVDRLRWAAARPAAQVEDVGGVELPSGEAPPDVTAIERDLEARVRRALDHLAPHERLPITLAFLEGGTHAEVAARLGWPLGTVKTRIRAGLARLRPLLAH